MFARLPRPAFRTWFAASAKIGVAVAALAALTPTARAHGPLHEQIAAITAELGRTPNEAELYVRRGNAYHGHGDYDAAIADFDRAAKLAPGRDDLDFLKAQSLVSAGRALQAKALLDRYIKRHADAPAAYMLRARALERLGDPKEASRDYDQALARLPEPTPDDFIARADAQIAAGQLDQALRDLDGAIRRIGPLITLDLKALEIEERTRRWDAALARVDRMMAPLPRKESWLVRRGQILAQAGRRQDARQAFLGALDALAALPPHLRNVPAMVELETKAKDGLKAISAPGRAPRRARARAARQG